MKLKEKNFQNKSPTLLLASD